MKECRTCKEVKTWPDFPFRKAYGTRQGRYRENCKPCTNKKALLYKKAASFSKVRSVMSKEEAVLSQRHHYYKRNYGLTLDAYNAMFADQLGCCNFCGVEEKDAPKGKLHVDHDHDTGEVRSLLCHHCNVGIGNFGDSSANLFRAAECLKKFGK